MEGKPWKQSEKNGLIIAAHKYVSIVSKKERNNEDRYKFIENALISEGFSRSLHEIQLYYESNIGLPRAKPSQLKNKSSSKHQSLTSETQSLNGQETKRTYNNEENKITNSKNCTDHITKPFLTELKLTNDQNNLSSFEEEGKKINKTSYNKTKILQHEEIHNKSTKNTGKCKNEKRKAHCARNITTKRVKVIKENILDAVEIVDKNITKVEFSKINKPLKNEPSLSESNNIDHVNNQASNEELNKVNCLTNSVNHQAVKSKSICRGAVINIDNPSLNPSKTISNTSTKNKNRVSPKIKKTSQHLKVTEETPQKGKLNTFNQSKKSVSKIKPQSLIDCTENPEELIRTCKKTEDKIKFPTNKDAKLVSENKVETLTNYEKEESSSDCKELPVEDKIKFLSNQDKKVVSKVKGKKPIGCRKNSEVFKTTCKELPVEDKVQTPLQLKNSKFTQSKIKETEAVEKHAKDVKHFHIDDQESTPSLVNTNSTDAQAKVLINKTLNNTNGKCSNEFYVENLPISSDNTIINKKLTENKKNQEVNFNLDIADESLNFETSNVNGIKKRKATSNVILKNKKHKILTTENKIEVKTDGLNNTLFINETFNNEAGVKPFTKSCKKLNSNCCAAQKRQTRSSSGDIESFTTQPLEIIEKKKRRTSTTTVLHENIHIKNGENQDSLLNKVGDRVNTLESNISNNLGLHKIGIINMKGEVKLDDICQNKKNMCTNEAIKSVTSTKESLNLRQIETKNTGVEKIVVHTSSASSICSLIASTREDIVNEEDENIISCNMNEAAIVSNKSINENGGNSPYNNKIPHKLSSNNTANTRKSKNITQNKEILETVNTNKELETISGNNNILFDRSLSHNNNSDTINENLNTGSESINANDEITQQTIIPNTSLISESNLNNFNTNIEKNLLETQDMNEGVEKINESNNNVIENTLTDYKIIIDATKKDSTKYFDTKNINENEDTQRPTVLPSLRNIDNTDINPLNTMIWVYNEKNSDPPDKIKNSHNVLETSFKLNETSDSNEFNIINSTIDNVKKSEQIIPSESKVVDKSNRIIESSNTHKISKINRSTSTNLTVATVSNHNTIKSVSEHQCKIIQDTANDSNVVNIKDNKKLTAKKRGSLKKDVKVDIPAQQPPILGLLDTPVVDSVPDPNIKKHVKPVVNPDPNYRKPVTELRRAYLRERSKKKNIIRRAKKNIKRIENESLRRNGVETPDKKLRKYKKEKINFKHKRYSNRYPWHYDNYNCYYGYNPNYGFKPKKWHKQSHFYHYHTMSCNTEKRIYNSTKDQSSSKKNGQHFRLRVKSSEKLLKIAGDLVTSHMQHGSESHTWHTVDTSVSPTDYYALEEGELVEDTSCILDTTEIELDEVKSFSPPLAQSLSYCSVEDVQQLVHNYYEAEESEILVGTKPLDKKQTLPSNDKSPTPITSHLLLHSNDHAEQLVHTPSKTDIVDMYRNPSPPPSPNTILPPTPRGSPKKVYRSQTELSQQYTRQPLIDNTLKTNDSHLETFNQQSNSSDNRIDLVTISSTDIPDSTRILSPEQERYIQDIVKKQQDIFFQQFEEQKKKHEKEITELHEYYYSKHELLLKTITDVKSEKQSEGVSD